MGQEAYSMRTIEENLCERQLDGIVNFHCNSLPARGARQTDIAEIVAPKRGSVYHTSSDVRRIRKIHQGRRKIDSSLFKDSFLTFEIVNPSSAASTSETTQFGTLGRSSLNSTITENEPIVADAQDELRHESRLCSLESLELSLHALRDEKVKLDRPRMDGSLVIDGKEDRPMELFLYKQNVKFCGKSTSRLTLERDSIESAKAECLSKSFSAKAAVFSSNHPPKVAIRSPKAKPQASPLKKMLNPIKKSKSLRAPSLLANDSAKKDCLSENSAFNEVDASLAAHLHATLKLDSNNGISLFEFTVKDPEDTLLARAWKTESELNWIYTFHDCSIRRGTNAISPLPPIIGQMQVGSYLCSEVREDGSFGNSSITEFTLYDIAHARRSCSIDGRICPWPQEDLHSHIEIVAIVIQNMFNKNEIKKGSPNNVAGKVDVVTPSGIHGLPEMEGGYPSPLLGRWRYGGGCDCGGWDMACPIIVLENDYNSDWADSTPKECRESMVLFVKGTKLKLPSLSVTSNGKGQFAVDFHAQFSALQAFSICVALLHCSDASPVLSFSASNRQRMYSTSLRLLLEEEVRHLIEAVAVDEKRKSKARPEKNAPPAAKLDPPFSPLGRA